ncbi:hypothetical protein KVV02_007530 [Mortierella alpina]|uniref:CN hydrolase domain-containing protein n=1 Tax=Mortierella alpina TaxID=64518 RepID=A0A9P8AAQ1_MORAP|nr:hypothetical protein KVV02_007530 [Mortierella alpina]
MLRNLISVPSFTTVIVPLVVLTCTVFGPGLLNVAPAPYLAIALSLGYLERLGPWSFAVVMPNVYLYACLTVGTGLAYAGMLQSDNWDNSLMRAPFLIGLWIGLVNIIPLWIHLAWQRRFLPQERLQSGLWSLLATLVAPSVWVALFTMVYAVSPIGSYGSIAYTQFQLGPLVQWSSVAGIAGIEFLVAGPIRCFRVWSAVILHRACVRYIRLESYHDADTKNWSQMGTQVRDRTRLLNRLAFAPTPTFMFVMLFVSLYGSMRFWNATGTFYMRPLRDTMLPTVKASCVIGSAETNDLPGYLNQTVELAKGGSEIVLWSETLVRMNSTQMVTDFYTKAGNISATYGIYLGVTFSQFLDEHLVQSKNMFTLFDPRGQVAFEYQKAHPVAMVETTVVAGPNKLPVADTEKFGRLGGAICFDLDFQNFIAQAGDQKVDILLQPSWTWASIGRLEATIQSYRAVEQGFTIFRCGSWAPSTVWDPFHQLWGYKENLGSGTFTAEIPLRKHVSTIYTAVGNLWGYVCCAFAVVSLILVVAPKRIVDQWLHALEARVSRRVVSPPNRDSITDSSTGSTLPVRAEEGV